MSSITKHGLTEIRIVRGEKDSTLNGMVRIYGYIGNEAVIIGADLFNCLGDILEEEEE